MKKGISKPEIGGIASKIGTKILAPTASVMALVSAFGGGISGCMATSEERVASSEHALAPYGSESQMPGYQAGDRFISGPSITSPTTIETFLTSTRAGSQGKDIYKGTFDADGNLTIPFSKVPGVSGAGDEQLGVVCSANSDKFCYTDGGLMSYVCDYDGNGVDTASCTSLAKGTLAFSTVIANPIFIAGTNKLCVLSEPTTQDLAVWCSIPEWDNGGSWDWQRMQSCEAADTPVVGGKITSIAATNTHFIVSTYSDPPAGGSNEGFDDFQYIDFDGNACSGQFDSLDNFPGIGNYNTAAAEFNFAPAGPLAFLSRQNYIGIVVDPNAQGQGGAGGGSPSSTSTTTGVSSSVGSGGSTGAAGGGAEGGGGINEGGSGAGGNNEGGQGGTGGSGPQPCEVDYEITGNTESYSVEKCEGDTLRVEVKGVGFTITANGRSHLFKAPYYHGGIFEQTGEHINITSLTEVELDESDVPPAIINIFGSTSGADGTKLEFDIPADLNPEPGQGEPDIVSYYSKQHGQTLFNETCYPIASCKNPVPYTKAGFHPGYVPQGTKVYQSLSTGNVSEDPNDLIDPKKGVPRKRAEDSCTLVAVGGKNGSYGFMGLALAGAATGAALRRRSRKSHQQKIRQAA